MEKSPIEGIEIPRNSPTTRAWIAQRAIELTWYNSTLYRFAEPYTHMSHVFIRNPGDEPNYNVFGQPALMDILEDKKYPVLTSQEPSNSDIESYLQYSERLMERELKDLGSDDE